MANTRMVGFGYKTGWLAIRDGNLPDVLDVLGAQIGGRTTWQEGVHRAYIEERTVIVTPLLPGDGGTDWMLVAGWWVAAQRDSIDIATLSAALDHEVQLFVTHRVTELHRWERAVGGDVLRSFEYVGKAGEVMRWRGVPDATELAIGLPPTFDIERTLESEDRDILVGEGDVMRVAAAWSVDPTSLEGRPAHEPLTVAQFPSP